MVCFLFFFSDDIFKIYTQDEEMLSIMNSILPFFLLSEINSNLAGILKGLIKSMGRQSELAKFSILINVVMVNGFALFFCFYIGMGLRGLWLGLVAAYTIGNIIFSYKIFTADWRQESQKSLDRIMGDKRKLIK